MTIELNRREVLAASAIIFASKFSFAQQTGSSNAAQSKAAVLNRCTRVSSMSQRIVKLKALQFLQISSDATSNSIIATEKLLSSHVSFLASSIPAALKANGDLLSDHVRNLLVQVAMAPSKSSLLASAKQATITLQQSESLASELKKGFQGQGALALEVAGTQRMLLQRMAKNYFLIASGVEPPTGSVAIDTDRKFYADGLQMLSNSPDNDNKIKEKIAAQTNLYRKYEAMLADRSPSAFSKPNLGQIYTLSEQLLTACHEIAMDFEAKNTA